MPDTVRVGVVGTSWWADLMHLPNLKSHPRAQLRAICGRSRIRAQELATKYAIPQVFTDYHDLISHGNLQALIVATPDDLHYPITMAALDAGLHVLCEKPLALTAIQARAMYEKAEAVGVKHIDAAIESHRSGQWITVH
jgi:predicted dehydrogenase